MYILFIIILALKHYIFWAYYQLINRRIFLSVRVLHNNMPVHSSNKLKVKIGLTGNVSIAIFSIRFIYFTYLDIKNLSLYF